MKINHIARRIMVLSLTAFLLLGAGACSNSSPNQFEGHYFGVGADDAAYYAIKADVDAAGQITGTLTYYDGTTPVPAASVDIPDDNYGMTFDITGQVTDHSVTVTSVQVDDTDPQATFTGTISDTGIVKGTIDNADSDRTGTFTAQPVSAADEVGISCGGYDLLEIPPVSIATKKAYDDSGDVVLVEVNGTSLFGIFDSWYKDTNTGFTGLEATVDGTVNFDSTPCSTGCTDLTGTISGTYDGGDSGSLVISGGSYAVATENSGTVGHTYQYFSTNGSADSGGLNVGFSTNTNWCYSFDVVP